MAEPEGDRATVGHYEDWNTAFDFETLFIVKRTKNPVYVTVKNRQPF